MSRSTIVPITAGLALGLTGTLFAAPVADASPAAPAPAVSAPSATPQALPSARASVAGIPANTFTYNRQEDASVAVDAVGRAFVVWGSRRQEAGSFGVFGRLFDASGRPIGGEIAINTYWPNNQESPAVACGPDGRFWVAWTSHGQDAALGAVVARGFAIEDGVFRAVTDECVLTADVDGAGAGDQRHPTIAAGPSGALVAWTTSELDGSPRVMARVVRPDGTTGPAVRVTDAAATSPSAATWQPAPAPASVPAHAGDPADAADHGFILAWSGLDRTGLPDRIDARRLDAAGAPLGDVVRLSPADERRHLEPSLAAAGPDRLALAWMATADDQGYDVSARLFDARLAVVADLEPAIPHGQRENGAAIAASDAGAVAVSWNVYGPAAGGLVDARAIDVWTQSFDRAGRPLTAARRAHEGLDGIQQLTVGSGAARSAVAPDGTVLHAINGRGPHDGRGVTVHRLTAAASAGADASAASPSTATATATATAVAADTTVADAAPALTVDPALVPRDLTPALVAEAQRAAPPVFDPNFVPEPRDPPLASAGADFGFIGFQDTGWNPPDPDIATGPNHVVVAVNGGIRFYTKDGIQTFSAPIAGATGFWGEVGAESFVFDPVCVFDTLSQRFIVACTEHADNDDDYLVLAVSDDDDPNGTWFKYRFFMNDVGRFIDFPNLGVDGDAIYICTDFFSAPTGNWIHIIDKADVLVGAPTAPVSIQTAGGFRSLGAVTSYDADAPAAYFATTYAGGGTSVIEIDGVVDPTGFPVRSTVSVPVPSYSEPPSADQQGSSNLVSTVGRRLKHGVYRNGRLWLAHTTGEGGTARVRWYEIDPRGWPTSGFDPVLIQSGTQDLGPGRHNWFADIHVDDAGNAAIAFNQSSSSEFVSVRRTFRLATDPLGTLREPVTMQESTAPVQGNRYGDYAGLDEDPVEPSVFWNHHEYYTSSWRTWVGRFDIFEGLGAFGIQYPDGKPELLDANGGTTVRVLLVPEAGTPLTDSAVLHVDPGDGGGFVTIPMTRLAGELYEGAFPAVACGVETPWFVSAESTDGGTITDPADAPGTTNGTPAWTDITIAFADDFESDQGWAVSGDAADGQWDRGVPVGGGDRGDPPTDGDGSGQCFLTDNVDDNSDVDGGTTILTSPVMDATGDPVLRYWRWYDNTAGASPGEDVFVVEVSDDAGATWTELETVGPDTPESAGGWFEVAFAVADVVTPNDQFRVRFIASDLGAGSVVEAGVDGVELVVTSCSDPVCTGDLDASGDVGFNDLLTLLGSYGDCPGCPADLDESGAVDFNDLLILLSAWGPCP